MPASPETVYDALVDPKKHSAFSGAKATGKPEVGGKFTAWDGYISGRHLVLERGKRIVQEWMTTDWPEGYPPSTIEFILCSTSEGTEIQMVQSNVPADQAEELAEGWVEFYWTPLRKYFSK